ncbi:site-specific integrase [Candidatus Entotheonella palauensis]|uniref:site-specific integrase n=1 Tax=Candidatus Entotheonella palauensis TaxID=93172 RepID=UPI000B7EED61|nr:site-specific integrase [Candidatus Entotheonella palauensis]
MFETLFSRPAAIQRHHTGPYAKERRAYLAQLAAQRTPRATMRIRAHYCLTMAKELDNWPPDYQFTQADIDTIAAAWATESVANGRAATATNPRRTYRMVAVAFLRCIDRLRPEPSLPPGRYADRIEAFIEDQRQNRWQSEETCRNGRWKVVSFLSYLEGYGYDLERIDVSHVDAYFQHLSHRLSRPSLRTVAIGLRAWFRYCETRGWTRPGLADAILVPRVYQHESLPLGPTWDQVSRMIDEASGDDPANLRNRAILLLLAVYGLRSGEVRRLQLDDVDWQQDRLRIQRSKSGKFETFPLEPSTGNAIACYLRNGRPPSQSRVLFLTLRAPYRALSNGALHNLVRRYLAIVGWPVKGYGSHGLRHACARHLLEAGHSFKEVGDHLGHRSPRSTSIYAKANLEALRLVAFDHLGGLT